MITNLDLLGGSKKRNRSVLHPIHEQSSAEHESLHYFVEQAAQELHETFSKQKTDEVEDVKQQYEKEKLEEVNAMREEYDSKIAELLKNSGEWEHDIKNEMAKLVKGFWDPVQKSQQGLSSAAGGRKCRTDEARIED